MSCEDEDECSRWSRDDLREHGVAADPVPEFDLYAALGVPLDSDTGAIERAWRDRVRATHPDRASKGGDREATARTVRLNIARDWLTDPTRRAHYDFLRRPRAEVELPALDPLAHWPDSRSTPIAMTRSAWFVPAVVAFVVLSVTVAAGIGSGIFILALFALSLIVLAYYGLLGLPMTLAPPRREH